MRVLVGSRRSGPVGDDDVTVELALPTGATPATSTTGATATGARRGGAGSGDGPRIDPRMARRVVEVRRAAGRRRLRALLGVLAALAAGALVAGILESPLARVRHLRIDGAGPLPAALVARTAGLGARTPMVSVDGAAAAARLEALPLVAFARVRRSWPSTVRIHLVLRTPVAVAAAGGRQAAVDATGRVLGAAASAAGLPEVDVRGALPAPGASLAGADTGPLAAELALAAAAHRVLPAAVSLVAIHLDAGGLVAVVAAAGPAGPPGAAGPAGPTGPGTPGGAGTWTARLGPPAPAATEAAELAALAAVLAGHPPAAGSTVDLEVPDRPVVTLPPPLTAVGPPATVSTHARG